MSSWAEQPGKEMAGKSEGQSCLSGARDGHPCECGGPATPWPVMTPELTSSPPRNKKHLQLSAILGGWGYWGGKSPPVTLANCDPKPSSVRFANLKILLAFRTVIYCMFCHSKYFPKGHAKFTPELPGSDNRLLAAPSILPPSLLVAVLGCKRTSASPAPRKEEMTMVMSSRKKG